MLPSNGVVFTMFTKKVCMNMWSRCRKERRMLVVQLSTEGKGRSLGRVNSQRRAWRFDFDLKKGTFFNSPPEVLSTEEQHLASPSLQRSLHLLNAAGEAELLYAAGTQDTLPCVHPESGPCRKKMIIMKTVCTLALIERGPLHTV